MRPGSIPLTAVVVGFAVVAMSAHSTAVQVVQVQRPAVPTVPGQTATEPIVELKPGAGRIVGKVVEAGTATGVAGAVVTLLGGALGPPTALFTNGIPGGARRIIADSQGQFYFIELPAGEYNLTSTAAGYLNGAYGETRVIVIRRSLDLVRTLQVTESDGLVPATIQMWRNGGISGRVVDERGEPMVGIQVSVIARLVDWGGPVMTPTQLVTTDDRGMYHADMTPGDYVVGVLAATTTVPTSAVEGFLDAQRQGGAVLQAYLTQVIGAGSLLPRGVGTRVGNVMVQQFGSQNSPVVPPIRVGAGGATFYPSAFHPASPLLAGATIISVGSSEEKTGIDVVMRPAPVRRVTGRVVGPDGPVVNVALTLIPPDPSVARVSPAILIDTPQALTDGNGDFTFLGVAPGSYNIRVIRRPTSTTEPTLWATGTLAVGDTDVSDLEVRMQRGARISGRIVVESTGPPPDPKQFLAVGVAARPVPGSLGALHTWPGPDRGDASGRFTTREFIPGQHMMVVSGIPSGWTLKSVTTNGQNAVDKAFELSSSGISDMVVTLTNQITTVTGVARDGSGVVVHGATVAAFPTDRSLWRIPGMASRRVQTAAPGRDGRYMFRGLPAGEYFIVAVDWPSADFSDGNVLSKVMASATRVTLNDGESKTQDLLVRVMR